MNFPKEKRMKMNLTEKYWKKLFGQITSKGLILMKIKQRFGQIRDIRFLLM
jgi:hypothetical protein